MIVAGRFLPRELREVGDLVDAARFDATALSITGAEVVEALPNCAPRDAERIVEAADGSVKVVVAALEQHERNGGRGDALTDIVSVQRAAAAASLHSLSSSDGGLVGMLARAPGLDERFLDKLGGPGFVERIVTAGVPLRRRIDGTIDLLNEASFRSIEIEPATALRLARELVERERHIEAVGLLLDAGAHERAAVVMTTLPQSVTDTVESRTLLSVLARLGSMTEQEPSLLLLRSTALSLLGRFDVAGERPRPGDGAGGARRPAVAAAGARPARPSPGRRRPLRRGAPGCAGGAARPRCRRGAHLRPGPVGARRGGRDERPPRRPAACRRVLQRGDPCVGGLRGVRQGPGVPVRPGHQCAGAARALRRGAGGDERGARRQRRHRGRARLDAAHAWLRAGQRQPHPARRVPLRARGRARSRAGQPSPRRRRGVGEGPGGDAARRSRGDAAVGRDRREHRPRRGRRPARPAVPVRRRHRPRRAR